jgi:hypothetical protein
VPLVYGSAATLIDPMTRRWQMVEHAPGEWVSIDDMTLADNLIGKRLRLKRNHRVIGIGVYPEERDEAFAILLDQDKIVSCWTTDEVEVIDDGSLNQFEQVIAANALFARHIPAMAAVVEQARRFRLDMKRRVLGLGGTLRARLLADFNWTEADLDEVR